ncbi:hypothetical protein P692DRAFT_20784528 [Suillus brevipes Sb2]|nr:hypothetical protein P692DRAFT_20784528 [Suillus brevipes Sb2]
MSFSVLKQGIVLLTIHVHLIFSHTICFSSAFLLAVAAALTSSISAKPLADDNAGGCHAFCWLDMDCKGCSIEACWLPFCFERRS